MNSTPKYDVLGVDLKPRLVRFMTTGKDAANADAVMNMAVLRRGVDEEFFVVVLAGSYKEGEKWTGRK